MEDINKRIGNLQLRKCRYICKEENLPEHVRYSLDRWQPNSYYGREHEFIKDGDFYRPNNEQYNFVVIHKDCFKSPEYCYTIGTFDYDKSDGSYEFRFIGNRPLDLKTKMEREWFWKLVEYGYKKLNNHDYEDEKE